MADSITINGRSIDIPVSVRSHDGSIPTPQTQNEADPNLTQTGGGRHIIIRTTGAPLKKAQKTQLHSMGATIAEFVGTDTEQIYLCNLVEDDSGLLDDIAALEYISYAGVYADEFAVPVAVQADSSAAEEAAAKKAAQEKDAHGPVHVAVDVQVLLQHDVTEPSDELLQKIADAANVTVDKLVVADGDQGGVSLKVSPDKLDEIAKLEEVRVMHSVNEPALFDNVARAILKVDKVTGDADSDGKPARCTGSGQIVCVADTGLDKGSEMDVHEAFAGRVKALFPWGRTDAKLADDPDGHGTHVCGAVAGSGRHDVHGVIEGTAPAAELLVQSLFSVFDTAGRPRLGGIPKTNLAPLFQQAYDAGARVHSNSWGSPLPPSGIQRPYDGRTESIDRFVWEHQDMTVLFAAGNDGQDVDHDGKLDGTINPRSLGGEASAKNCITVGATENFRPTLVAGPATSTSTSTRPYTYGGFWTKRFAENPLRDDHMANNPDGLAAFSSRGPTAEHRLKPDVVAPGTAILSARSQRKRFLASVDLTGVSGDDRYMYLSGTSMATPLVAGTCAVLRQALLANGHRDEESDGTKNPTGALIKALLINGAVSISGQYMPGAVEDEPNPHSGFGRVDLSASLPVLGSEYSGYGIATVADSDEAEADQESVVVLKQITVPTTTPATAAAGWSFKVTLAYADLPGGRLQNDMNLVVVAGGHERHGNQPGRQFDVGSTEPFDRRNNVEQVVWQGLSAGGSVHIAVKPFRFMSGRVPVAYAWRFL